MFIVGGGLALFSGEILKILMPKIYLSSSIPLIILCFVAVLQGTHQIIDWHIT